MTISELAKIALDEGRQMYVRRKDWRATRREIYLHSFLPFVVRFWLDDLLADDWYEVKD